MSFEESGDASLSLSVVGGKQYAFTVRSIPILSRARALDFRSAWKSTPLTSSRPLIASLQLVEHTREVLRQGGISWIEAETGVCHLVAPGILIDTKVEVRGQQSDTGSTQFRLRRDCNLKDASVAPSVDPDTQQAQGFRCTRDLDGVGVFLETYALAGKDNERERSGARPIVWIELIDPRKKQEQG